MILDGYGLNDGWEGANAVCEARTPVMDQLMSQCPFVRETQAVLRSACRDGQMEIRKSGI